MKFRKFLAVFLATVCLMSVLSFNVSAAEEILCDVNGDRKINTIDYGQLKQAVMGKKELTDAQFARGDINGNGKIDIMDYSSVKRHVMGISKIVGTVKPRTAIDKIVTAIGKSKKISLNFKTTLNDVNADATVSFEIVKNVLHLKGYAKAENGVVVDLDIPLSALAKEYTFSGEAEFEAANLEGSCTGKIVAATYSVDRTYFDEIKLTANIPITNVEKTLFESNCKAAMDQFLYQANILLESKKIGVNIGDLGFTNYLQEIEDGWVEF